LRPYWKLPRLLYPSILFDENIDINCKKYRTMKFCDSLVYNESIPSIHNGLKNIYLKTSIQLMGFSYSNLVFTKIIGSKILISKRDKLRKTKQRKKKK